MKINGEIVTKDWLELEYRNKYGYLSYEGRNIDNEAVERALTSAYEELTGEYSEETYKFFEIFGGEPEKPCTLEEALREFHGAVCNILENDFYNQLTRESAETMCRILLKTKSTIRLAGDYSSEGPVLSGRIVREGWNKRHPDDQIPYEIELTGESF